MWTLILFASLVNQDYSLRFSGTPQIIFTLEFPLFLFMTLVLMSINNFYFVINFVLKNLTSLLHFLSLVQKICSSAIFCYDCMTMPIRLETLPWRIYLCVYTWTWFLGQSCILLRHFSTFVDLAEWNCRRIKRSRVENFSPPNCRLWWPLRQESIDYKLGEEQNFANLTHPPLSVEKMVAKSQKSDFVLFQIFKHFLLLSENC